MTRILCQDYSNERIGSKPAGSRSEEGDKNLVKWKKLNCFVKKLKQQVLTYPSATYLLDSLSLWVELDPCLNNGVPPSETGPTAMHAYTVYLFTMALLKQEIN